MGIAFVAAKLRPLLDTYRAAWKTAGHPGAGEVMLTFTSIASPTARSARAFAAPFLDRYLASLADAAADWLDGRTSTDYPGYDKVIAALRASNAAEQIASGSAWIIIHRGWSGIHAAGFTAFAVAPSEPFRRWFHLHRPVHGSEESSCITSASDQ